jgi:hypothetical protein
MKASDNERIFEELMKNDEVKNAYRFVYRSCKYDEENFKYICMWAIKHNYLDADAVNIVKANDENIIRWFELYDMPECRSFFEDAWKRGYKQLGQTDSYENGDFEMIRAKRSNWRPWGAKK